MLKENYTSGASDYRSLVVGRPLARGSVVRAIISHYGPQHGGTVVAHPAFIGHSAGQGSAQGGYSQLSKQLSHLPEVTYGCVIAADR